METIKEDIKESAPLTYRDVFISEAIKENNNMETKITNLADLGAFTFSPGVTDKGEDRTPHYEFIRQLEMYNTCPLVSTGINQYNDMLISNDNLRVVVEGNDKAEDFINDWLDARGWLLEEVKQMETANTIFGNAPVQFFYKKGDDGKTYFNGIGTYNDMSRIFVNLEDEDGSKKYILMTPQGQTSFKFAGKVKTPTQIQVGYIKNNVFMRFTIYGVYISDGEMDLRTTGFSSDNVYGRSILASGIDAFNVYSSIIGAWDTIARNKAIDQKIMTLDKDGKGFQMSKPVQEDIEDKLADTGSSFKILPYPLKMLEQDIKVSGNYDTLEGVFDLVRRMLVMSLLPQHLTPWSDSATTMGSEQAMPAFMLRLKSRQGALVKYLNEIILSRLRKDFGKENVPFNATFVFDTPQLSGNVQDYTSLVDSLINQGVITREQIVDYYNKLGVFEGIELDTKNLPKETNETESLKGFSESLGGNESYEEFSKRVNKLNNKTGFSLSSKSKELSKRDIGGIVVRLIKDENSYLIFQSLLLHKVERVDEGVSQAKETYDALIKHLLDEQEIFDDEESEEDKLLDGVGDDVEKDWNTLIDDIISMLDKKEKIKESLNTEIPVCLTEGFLSDTFFPGLKKKFNIFGSRINRSVGRALTKHNIIVNNEVGTIPRVDNEAHDKVIKKGEKTISDKQRLMQDVILQSVEQTKNNVSQMVMSDIADMVGRGVDVKDIKNQIRTKYDYKSGIVNRFDVVIKKGARTAGSIIKLRKWKNLGLTRAQLRTRRDEKVRNSHRKLNKHVFLIDDLLSGKKPLITDEWGCRCSWIPYE